MKYAMTLWAWSVFKWPVDVCNIFGASIMYIWQQQCGDFWWTKSN